MRIGRVFMLELDCPFRAVDAEVAACPLKQGADAILLDFHAEATSEKQAMGVFLDGRVSCVVGTHTHAPTADERVLPGGTAYMSDAGMCGDYNSVLGMETEEPVNRFLTRIPRGRFEPATGPATLSGLAVEIDDKHGPLRRRKSSAARGCVGTGRATLGRLRRRPQAAAITWHRGQDRLHGSKPVDPGAAGGVENALFPRTEAR